MWVELVGRGNWVANLTIGEAAACPYSLIDLSLLVGGQSHAAWIKQSACCHV